MLAFGCCREPRTLSAHIAELSFWSIDGLVTSADSVSAGEYYMSTGRRILSGQRAAFIAARRASDDFSRCRISESIRMATSRKPARALKMLMMKPNILDMGSHVDERFRTRRTVMIGMELRCADVALIIIAHAVFLPERRIYGHDGAR